MAMLRYHFTCFQVDCFQEVVIIFVVCSLKLVKLMLLRVWASFVFADNTLNSSGLETRSCTNSMKIYLIINFSISVITVSFNFFTESCCFRISLAPWSISVQSLSTLYCRALSTLYHHHLFSSQTRSIVFSVAWWHNSRFTIWLPCFENIGMSLVFFQSSAAFLGFKALLKIDIEGQDGFSAFLAWNDPSRTRCRANICEGRDLCSSAQES